MRLAISLFILALVASPSTAQTPTLAALYDHCERTLQEGDAAILYEKERADSFASCVAQMRAAYGDAGRQAALDHCPT